MSYNNFRENHYRLLFEMASVALEKTVSGKLLSENIIQDIAAEMITDAERHFTSSGNDWHHTLIQNIFLLNDSLQIISFNSDAFYIIGYHPKTVLKKEFGFLVAAESRLMWDDISASLLKQSNFNDNFEITLVSLDKLLLPAFCSVRRLSFTNYVLINAVTLIPSFDTDTNNGATLAKHNTVAYDLHAYIMTNLFKPLPTLKLLAVKFMRSPSSLTKDFSKVYQTTIYEYVKSERLKRAYILILKSNMQLKEIAVEAGFPTYPNFCRSFHQKFGMAPGDLRKNK